MIRYLVSFSLTFAFLGTIAQSGADRFLSSAVTDIEYMEVYETEQFLKDHKFASPWLRELDVRVRLSQYEGGIEEYRMRFGLINPFEIKANSDYRKMLNSQLPFQKKARLNDVFFLRYELLIEHYFVSERLSQVNRELQTLEALRVVALENATSLKDLVDMEETMVKLSLEREELNQQKQVLDIIIQKRTSGESLFWEDDAMISWQQIMDQLDSGQLDQLTVESLRARQELEEEESILKINKAEAFGNIGFIQTEYDLGKGDLPQDHLGFQIGLNLPVFNSDRPDLERRKLDMINEQVAVRGIDELEKEQYDFKMLKVNATLRQLLLVRDKLAQLDRLNTISGESEPDIDTTLQLLDLESYLKEKEITLYAELLLRFITMLHQKGQLAGEPLTNYLSTSLQPFILDSAE